jgi:hypothetical protein
MKTKLKTANVKYLLHSQVNVKKNQVYEKYLVQTEADIQALLKAGIITKLHVKGMRDYITKGEDVIVNDSGGYCNMKGTWEFVNEPEKHYTIKWEIDEFAINPIEAIKKAIAAFPHDWNGGDLDTLATVFDVEEIKDSKVVSKVQIDILEEDEKPLDRVLELLEKVEESLPLNLMDRDEDFELDNGGLCILLSKTDCTYKIVKDLEEIDAEYYNLSDDDLKEIINILETVEAENWKAYQRSGM